MAFAGMFLAAIFIIIAIIVFIIAIAELIVGLILLHKKKKVPGIILIVLAAIPVIAAAIGISVYAFKTNHPEFETYDGSMVTVNMRYVRKMQQLLREDDIDGLGELLDKHPELIYYQDINHTTILEYGVKSCDVRIMETAYDHGARFDTPTVFDGLVYDYSLQHFADDHYWNFIYSYDEDFEPRFVMGDATDEMIEAAKFAVDHGAATVWPDNRSTWYFNDMIKGWVGSDDVFTSTDKDLIRYANSVCP